MSESYKDVPPTTDRGNSRVILQLRVGCIKRFNLPMTEKVTMIGKVSVKAPDFRCNNCRVIFLYNFIVLDPEYYGPEIAPYSHIIPVRQLRGVNPGVLKEGDANKEATNRSLIMTIHGARIQGLDIIANVVRLEKRVAPFFNIRNIINNSWHY